MLVGRGWWRLTSKKDSKCQNIVLFFLEVRNYRPRKVVVAFELYGTIILCVRRRVSQASAYCKDIYPIRNAARETDF